MTTDVQDLMEFVEARVSAERPWLGSIDADMADVCDLADVLLERLRRRRARGKGATKRLTAALATVARLFSDHPEFDPRWLSMEREVPAREGGWAGL